MSNAVANISETDVPSGVEDKRDWNDKEVKKAYMKEYMREYMRKYRKNNTEYYEKERKYVINYITNRYNTDPEYREKKNEYNLRYYHLKRQEKLANAIPV
jgi:hypothetical protein